MNSFASDLWKFTVRCAFGFLNLYVEDALRVFLFVLLSFALHQLEIANCTKLLNSLITHQSPAKLLI
jgi:hypothetical protein